MGVAVSTKTEYDRVTKKLGRKPTAVETKQIHSAVLAWFKQPGVTTEMPAGWRPGGKKAPSTSTVTARAPAKPPARRRAPVKEARRPTKAARRTTTARRPARRQPTARRTTARSTRGQRRR